MKDKRMGNVLGEKIEKNIRYNRELDTYYVQFNFKDVNHLNSFPTLENARKFRDTVNAEKLRIKTEKALAEMREKDNHDIVSDRQEIYPFNVLKAMGVEDYRVSPDITDNFDEVIKSVCKERESICIERFYGNKETLLQIAQAYNVTRERIRQIIVKGLKRLKHYIYQYDAMKQRELRDQQTAVLRADLDKRRAELIQAMRETGVISSDMTVYFGEPTIDLDYSFESSTERFVRTSTIDELDLSIRTYNCLRRAGLYQLKDLMACNAEQISHIRNLGKKCFKELHEKLLMCGLRLQGDELL